MAATLLERAVSATGDDPIDTTVYKWNIATQTLCIVFMTLFFGLRVYARSFVLNGFSIEDWTCLGAWILGVCYSVIALIMGSYGGGLHIEDVPKEDLIPFSKTVYVTMVMYGPTAFLTKVSLLWIMTRVFKPFRKSVIFIYFFMVIMLLYYIPAVIVKIRICDPIRRFWNHDVEGTCLDQAAIILADVVVSVVSDFIVLSVPIPLTMKLQMPNKKKMRVMAILGAGGLACVSSIVRTVLIVRTGGSQDATYSFMRINMFGNAEIAIGVICACLPSLSALVSRVYHEYSAKRTTQSSEHEMSNMKPPEPAKPRCNSRLSQFDLTTTDRDTLVQNAQGQPKIETSIESGSWLNDGQDGLEDGRGIMKTVDMSTSFSSAK